MLFGYYVTLIYVVTDEIAYIVSTLFNFAVSVLRCHRLYKSLVSDIYMDIADHRLHIDIKRVKSLKIQLE